MSRRYAAPLFLMLVALAMGTGGIAATLTVPGSYSTIQAAITAASPGDEVAVAPGTYHERLNFGGKAITVRSTAPTNPAVVASTIINGDKGGSVVTFNHSETTASVLSGFTITNGSGTSTQSNHEGGGLYTLNASPTITHNAIHGNTATFGGGIYCDGGSPIISGNVVSGHSVMFSGGGIYTIHSTATIANNLVTGNTADYWGGGIHIEYGGGSVVNNTLSGNASTRYHGALTVIGATAVVRNNIIAFSTVGRGVFISGTIDMKYCDVYGNTAGNYYTMADQTGSNGNVSVDPLFANAAAGDYPREVHRRALERLQAGSATPSAAPVSTLAIPPQPMPMQPAPNGARANMGAYGNTAYASKSGSASSPPVLVSATGVDATHVNLLFTKALNATTVTSTANYSISPTLTVSSATLDANAKTVHLTTAAQVAATQYTVTVSGVKDTLGNAIVAGSGDSASWTLPVIVPTVIAALPTGNHVNAERPTITAAFSTAMDHASVEAALDQPRAAGCGRSGWPGTFTWLGNQVQYKLSTALAPHTTYTVTISTGAQSSGGTPWPLPGSRSFTTTSAPAIVSYSPTGIAVPRSTTGRVIRIAFNQPMNKASAQAALWVYKSAQLSHRPAAPARQLHLVGQRDALHLQDRLTR